MRVSLYTGLLLLPAAALAQAGGQGASSPQNDVQQFVQTAAQMDMTQAHLGALAQQRGASQDVKNFGTQLAQTHKDAYNKLSQVAAATAFKVPSAIDAQHQQTIQRLQGLSGNQFDQAFKNQAIQSGQRYVNFLQQQAQSAQNPQIKQYASEMLPQAQSDLQQAQNLNTQAQTAGNSYAPQGVAPPAQNHNGNSSAYQGSGSSANTMAANDEHQGTVTRYEPGKLLELKVRNRIGRHVYDLGSISANIPGSLKPGDMVMASESVDQNGNRTLTVTRSNFGTQSAQANGNGVSSSQNTDSATSNNSGKGGR